MQKRYLLISGFLLTLHLYGADPATIEQLVKEAVACKIFTPNKTALAPVTLNSVAQNAYERISDPVAISCFTHIRAVRSGHAVNFTGINEDNLAAEISFLKAEIEKRRLHAAAHHHATSLSEEACFGSPKIQLKRLQSDSSVISVAAARRELSDTLAKFNELSRAFIPFAEGLNETEIVANRVAERQKSCLRRGRVVAKLLTILAEETENLRGTRIDLQQREIELQRLEGELEKAEKYLKALLVGIVPSSPLPTHLSSPSLRRGSGNTMSPAAIFSLTPTRKGKPSSTSLRSRLDEENMSSVASALAVTPTRQSNNLHILHTPPVSGRNKSATRKTPVLVSATTTLNGHLFR